VSINYVDRSQRANYTIRRHDKRAWLSSDQLHTVFVSQVVTRILYAWPAWGVFASVGQIGRIDAFLRRAYKCGISKDLFTFQDLLHNSGAMLFKKMQSSMHCLNTLLPPKRLHTDYVLRNSDTIVTNFLNAASVF